ncbi:Proliferation marker protein Ki-67 [Frankliniella fusca]|uniref:Proliferation marker protein Ki-67 n=1 Tax=Frankliniella fusca TaxID=407009 RepID=A0AAE1H8W7_9NEOP|nr:Proliferation marker protein Ki-67 [Frankliniella fusca]
MDEDEVCALLHNMQCLQLYAHPGHQSEEESTNWEPESDSGGELETECLAQEPKLIRTRPALAPRPTPAAQAQRRTRSAAASAEAILTGGRPKRLRK